MNDSQQEGFYQPSIETIIKTLSKTQSFKLTKKVKQFTLRPIVCAHYQLSLFQYPREIDTIQFTQETKPYTSLQFESQALVVRGQNSLQPLSECFPRNLECIYNKFREKTTYKRDLTLIIRNVSRLVKDESIGTFTQNRQNSLEPVTFSSDFEGGNLHFVYKQRKNQIYYLLLQNDVNTHGFNFWFYFNIRSKVRIKCTFVIVNLSRIPYFAGQSYIIVFNSLLKVYEKGVPFKSIETRYCRCDSQLPYWGLIFEYQLSQDSDLYFSLVLPYSYSRLNRFLRCVSENPTQKYQIKIDQSIKTPLGNTIHIVQFKNQERYSIKKSILILARQHPCETVGSFVCESMIKILSENNQISKSLLKRFKFIIVPMVNVDGVIHGNSRTNLMGYDLNRCWQRGRISQSSECDQLWKYFQKIYSQQNIIWTIDLHGHSKQHGFFIYFCQKNDKNMIISHILSKKNQSFRSDKCVYQVGSDKKQSIRAQLYNRLKIKNVLTIQISMFGFLNELKSFSHYKNKDLNQIGKNILQSLLQTERIFQKKSTRFRTMQEIINISLKNITNKEIDSESDPQGDYLKNEERNEFDDKILIQPKRNIERKRTKTEGSKQRKINSQFSANLTNNLSIQSGDLFSKDFDQKINTQKKLLFNLTFMNRSRVGRKRDIQSSQAVNRPKVLIIEEGRQISRFITRSENSSHQSDFGIKKSLEMRKRIRLAFENRIKSQRKTNPNLGLGLFASNQIKCVLYPTVKEEFSQKKERIELKKKFKSKKEQIKDLRNKQFGANIFTRFQSSFYLKDE